MNGDVVSVVERWDLAVTDVAALLEAGRQAHVRTWPRETYEDAVAAVENPALAMYAVAHETGAPWLELPGVELRSGTRLYVRPDVTPDRPEANPVDDEVVQPEGEVLFSETWA